MIKCNVTEFILASIDISNLRLDAKLACLLFSSQIYIASSHMRIQFTYGKGKMLNKQ